MLVVGLVAIAHSLQQEYDDHVVRRVLKTFLRRARRLGI
jgi:hypothetical protein